MVSIIIFILALVVYTKFDILVPCQPYCNIRKYFKLFKFAISILLETYLLLKSVKGAAFSV